MNERAVKASAAVRFLQGMERVGNRLPDPISLFLIMIGIVMVASWIAGAANWSVLHPGPDIDRVSAVNLFDSEQVRRIFTEMAQTFASFPPLGLVLLVMLGIGVAERSGLIETGLKAFVTAVPRSLISAAVVFAGMMSSLAVDAGYVVLIPLGAVLFYGVGRHPLAGLAAAFAGVSGGFSANLLITSVDVLLVSFTELPAREVDPGYTILFTANWFLMMALVPIFTIAGTIVTEKLVEPALGTYDASEAEEGLPEPGGAESGIRGNERRGLALAGVAVLLTALAMAFLVVPTPWWTPPLYDPEGELLVNRIGPFLRSIVAMMLFLFFIPGLVYGIATGSIKSDRDAANMTADTMASMGAYIVLAFVAAHLVAFFEWSNLGIILSVTGADALQAVGFTGIPLIVTFVMVAALMNLLIGSASAKWAIMAPIFVPMLMTMGYSPELVQAAYRIGDSVTNILTPLLPYFPLVIIFARKYDRRVGIGTILSAMLPYSVVFFIVGTLTLVVWMLLGLPLGPDAPIHYNPIGV